MPEPARSNQALFEENVALELKVRELGQAALELVRSQEALKQKEEKYEKAFHTNQESISINRVSDGLYVEVNEGHAKLTGYTGEELVGKTSLEINIWVVNSDRERFAEELRRNGSIHKLEANFRRKDGSFFTGLISASIIELNGVLHSLNVTKDITDRKRTEEILRVSEERYRLLTQSSRDVIFTVAPDMTISTVSPSIEELIGYKPDEMVGFNILELCPIHPENYEMAQVSLQRLLCGEKSGPTEYKLVAKDGSLRITEVTGTPLVRLGKVIGYTGIARNITEKKNMEEALRESEERNRILSSLSFEGICILQNRCIVDANDTYVTMNGYSSLAEIMGQDVLNRLTPDSREEASVNISKKREGIFYRNQLKKDGTTFPVEITAKNILYRGVEARAVSVRDITDRKRMQDELTAYSEQLEKMIEKRTKELEQKTMSLEELNTALKVLLHHQEADRKDLEERFVANMKGLVFPFTEKLGKTQLNEQQKLYLNIIEKHLNEISSPLMTSMPQFKLTPSEIKIASLIKDGKTTKEIAKLFGIAISSVNTHRNSIRKKLNLVGKGTNLQSRLRSFK